MAGSDFPLIDRRRLLTATAAVVTAGIAPDIPLSAGEAIQPVALPYEKPVLTLCANTAHRLLEIERRNAMRQEAGLPLLPVAREWRRIKRWEDAQAFEQFAAVHAQAVLDCILKLRREAEGNPNWRPSFMECMAYQNQVRKILREQIQATRRISGGDRVCSRRRLGRPL